MKSQTVEQCLQIDPKACIKLRRSGSIWRATLVAAGLPSRTWRGRVLSSVLARAVASGVKGGNRATAK